MTYKQAVEELKALAAGKAWSLITETNSYGAQPINIHGYIEGAKPFGHAPVALTYQGAIDNVRKMLEPVEVADEPPPDDIPEIEPVTKRCVTVTGDKFSDYEKAGE